MSTYSKTNANASAAGLIMLIVSEMCFYTEDTINIYIVLSFIGMLTIVFANLRYATTRVKINGCGMWLLMMYCLYMFYGTFLLQRGTFITTTVLYRFFECMALYIGLTSVVRTDYGRLYQIFVVAALIAIIRMVAKEGSLIISGGVRIGDSLSGNVNGVAFNLGVISMITIWSYCIERKKTQVLVSVVLIVFMLLTGSKKALIIIVLDLLLVLAYYKNYASTWIKVAIIVSIGVYCIFNVPYLYSIVGSRIESMVATWLYGSSTELYSYSTAMRSLLIREALSFFQDKPIFGGGYNYFYSRTSTIYDYSHCNYVELLCSFGVFGTLLFYSRHLSILYHLFRSSQGGIVHDSDISRLALFLVITSLVLDWSAVSFSAQSIWYLPVILASVAVEREDDSSMLEMGTYE